MAAQRGKLYRNYRHPLLQGRHGLLERQGEGEGWLFAIVAVQLTTLAAVPLYFIISLQSLMLLYVLSVVITSLRHGTGPALVAAVLALSFHNFFFVKPNFRFGLPHEEDVSSLIFLSLIAIACGPAASVIRQQFLQLHQSNRQLEALRLLGHDLALAEDATAVWEATANQLRAALQADSCVLRREEDGDLRSHPVLQCSLGPEDSRAVEWTLKTGRTSGRFGESLKDTPWTFFPISMEGDTIAVAAIRFDLALDELPLAERELTTAMLQQAAETCGRIRLSGELASARVQTEMELIRSALLSSVSHDLKSPLAAIMGAAETLHVLDKQLASEDRRELADMILQESHRLDSYIQNLLDATRLENGSLRIERDWVSVVDIVGSAITRLKRYFPHARIEFQSRASLPLLFVNPALVEQALFNILENAVKYSPPEEPIRIGVEQGSNTCLIQIDDQGPGIPAHLREQVFDMFYVASEGDHRKPGTGMGLAICRGMIGAHGGRVWAEEGRDGRGTRFVVELPVVYPEIDDQQALTQERQA